MRKGQVLFSVFLIAVGAYALYSALGWSFKAKLFPISVSVPLIALAAAQLLWDLLGKAEAPGGQTYDMEFSASVAPALARRRAAGIFLWIAAFIVLVYLLSFPLAVPLFLFSYLFFQTGAGLFRSLGLTAVTWGLFHLVFQRLIHLPFEPGLIQLWLGI
jgi:hypothetical protein